MIDLRSGRAAMDVDSGDCARLERRATRLGLNEAAIREQKPSAPVSGAVCDLYWHRRVPGERVQGFGFRAPASVRGRHELTIVRRYSCHVLQGEPQE